MSVCRNRKVSCLPQSQPPSESAGKAGRTQNGCRTELKALSENLIRGEERIVRNSVLHKINNLGIIQLSIVGTRQCLQSERERRPFHLTSPSSALTGGVSPDEQLLQIDVHRLRKAKRQMRLDGAEMARSVQPFVFSQAEKLCASGISSQPHSFIVYRPGPGLKLPLCSTPHSLHVPYTIFALHYQLSFFSI